MDDAAAMREAVALGEAARVGAGQDPWVGCVVLADGAVVGAGAHERIGGPHAERIALDAAGERARGATAVVTLEPCNHHARTPPCVDALVDAGVERVVVAITDPDSRVAGSGIARLRATGVEVTVGVEAPRARESLRPYLHHRTSGRPWCVLKAGISLDGRVAAADGSSRWITGEEARRDVHRLRARSQAIVVGSGTAMTDEPRLTVRDTTPLASPAPLRVLLDGRGRTPARGPLFDVDLAPTMVVTTSNADPAATRAWKEAGAEVEEAGPDPGGGVDLDEVLDLLGRRGMVQVLVEGGPTVQARFLERGLAHELVVYVAPTVLGSGARPLIEGLTAHEIASAPRWEVVETGPVGEDVRITVRTHTSGEHG